MLTICGAAVLMGVMTTCGGRQGLSLRVLVTMEQTWNGYPSNAASLRITPFIFAMTMILQQIREMVVTWIRNSNTENTCLRIELGHVHFRIETRVHDPKRCKTNFKNRATEIVHARHNWSPPG